MSSFDKDPARNLPLVRSPEPDEKRAAKWQIIATAIGAIVVVLIFLWGLNNQRVEGPSQQTAATQATPATPQGTNQPSVNADQKAQQQQNSNSATTTTGQNSGDQGDAGEKPSAGANAKQKPTNPGQNGPPTESSGQPAQQRGQ